MKKILLTVGMLVLVANLNAIPITTIPPVNSNPLMTAVSTQSYPGPICKSNGIINRSLFEWFREWLRSNRCYANPPGPVANVPDGGATATLLGLACAGIYIVKRKTRS